MGIITKIFAWGGHASYAGDLDSLDWFAFLVLLILVSFLWSRVIKQLE